MKLPQISGKELIKKLHRYGFIVIRQKGSHVRLETRTKDDALKLTIPFYSSLKKGTLLRIIKDAGLNVEEFNKL